MIVIEKALDFFIRFRTWLLGIVGVAVVFLPDLVLLVNEVLNSPDVIAVLPESWRKWASAICILLIVLSRWRPATRANDPEVIVKNTIDQIGSDAVIHVEGHGHTKAVIHVDN